MNVNRPLITVYEVETDTFIAREMTDEEYAELLASGWTGEAPDVVA
jgi:hypothetical protein